ncbi:PREDICTED: uncharacterized protein LOC105567536 [Vollenhovia emeryi]|uniref:uncharacterized protein LOC105567536 n=1 Tax=Vollenhovia emeryi TaxID=411798 RepID=UPI0005F4FD14|nr:PREDICTED: uncharacterized protein LOC105567536 [Vollenhovia emeryi]
MKLPGGTFHFSPTGKELSNSWDLEEIGKGGGSGGGHRGLIPRGRARRAKTERAQWSRDHQTNNTVLPPPSFGENGGRPTPTSSSSSSSLLFSRRRRRPLSQATDVGDAATDVVDLHRNAALRPAVVIPRNRIHPDRGWIPCGPGRSPESSSLRGEEQRAGDKEEEAQRSESRQIPGRAMRFAGLVPGLTHEWKRVRQDRW